MPFSSERSARNTFAQYEIDRASHLRLDDAQLKYVQAQSNSLELLLNAHGGLAMQDASSLLLRETAALPSHTMSRWYLGQVVLMPNSATASHVFARIVDAEECEGLSFGDLRSAGLILPAQEASLAAYAKGLLHWHARHRFCSVCGSETDVVLAGHKRKCRNTDCNAEHFPRTDSAIIVAVEYDGAILLGRHASWPEKRYSTLAGFVEPGETLEAALQREVFEESGVRIVSADYFSSQPWPFPASLMLAFTARAASADITLGDELEDARWFTVKEFELALLQGLLKVPPSVSVSFRLIEDWYLRQSGQQLADFLASLRKV